MTANTTQMIEIDDLEIGDLIDLQDDFYGDELCGDAEDEYFIIESIDYDTEENVSITFSNGGENYETTFPNDHRLRVLQD